MALLGARAPVMVSRMPRAALSGVLVVIGLAVVAGPPVGAQEPGAPAASDEELAALEARLGADHDQLIAPLVARGRSLVKEGQLEPAAQALTRAQAIVDQGLGLDHPQADLVLEALTRLRLAQDDTDAAVLAVGRRVEAAERRLRRSLAGSAPAARLALAQAAHDVLADYLLVAFKAGYSGYPTVLRFKGLVGRWARVERRAVRAIAAEERTLRESLAGARTALATLTGAAPGDDAKAWREAVTAAQARCDELARDLSARSSTQREAEGWLRAGVREVQTSLKDTDAVVDVVCAHGRYTAWVLRPKKAPVRVDLGEEQAMNDACARLVTLLRDAAKRAVPCEPEALDAAVRAASDVAWRPLEAAVGEATVIYLVPDAALAAVPYALLETSKRRPLLETRTVVHLETAQDLVAWRDGRTSGRGMAGVGGVDLGAAPDGVAPLFSSVPGSVADVRSWTAAFSKAYPDELARVLDGAQATKGALRALSTGKRVVHLASPSFANLDDDDAGGDATLDPMLLAGVALSGANARASAGDGILTALEAADFDLGDCDLIVLSACDTSNDSQRAGAGMLALMRGFRTAGARNVVATLWPTSDLATAAFMPLFYERWLGKGEGGRRSAPVAAREAALALRELVVEVEQDGVRQLLRPFEDPVYWAPFVTYGPAR